MLAEPGRAQEVVTPPLVLTGRLLQTKQGVTQTCSRGRRKPCRESTWVEERTSEMERVANAAEQLLGWCSCWPENGWQDHKVGDWMASRVTEIQHATLAAERLLAWLDAPTQ